jgi:hypothetical protein
LTRRAYFREATMSKKSSVSAEDFVRAWQQSESVAEVVEKTGSTVAAVYMRAKTYRKRGIALKTFRPRTDKLDVQALQKLAAELS